MAVPSREKQQRAVTVGRSQTATHSHPRLPNAQCCDLFHAYCGADVFPLRFLVTGAAEALASYHA
jgi:hypothetical protein